MHMDMLRRIAVFVCAFFVLFMVFAIVLDGFLVPYDGLLTEMRPTGTLRVAINDYFEVGFGGILMVVFAGTLAAGGAFALDAAPSRRV
jgi:hypothetical protein